MDMHEKHIRTEQHEALLSDFFRNITVIENLTQRWLQNQLPGKMLYSHYAVINYLIENPNTNNPAALADAFHVRRPSMTNTLGKLEKMGFVALRPHPTDGRAKLVLITDAGRNAHNAASTALASAYKEAVNAMGIELLKEIGPQLKVVHDFVSQTR